MVKMTKKQCYWRTFGTNQKQCYLEISAVRGSAARGLGVPLWNDLLRHILPDHKTSKIFRISFTLSKSPYFNNASLIAGASFFATIVDHISHANILDIFRKPF